MVVALKMGVVSFISLTSSKMLPTALEVVSSWLGREMRNEAVLWIQGAAADNSNVLYNSWLFGESGQAGQALA